MHLCVVVAVLVAVLVAVWVEDDAAAALPGLVFPTTICFILNGSGPDNRLLNITVMRSKYKLQNMASDILLGTVAKRNFDKFLSVVSKALAKGYKVGN